MPRRLHKTATLKQNGKLITRIVTWIETITPSCRDMTHLVSQSMDRRLSLQNRLAIWLHLTICDHCVRFTQHLGFIRKVSRSVLKYAEKMPSAGLPASAKEPMKEYVRQSPYRGRRWGLASARARSYAKCK
jgi:hypothetical protein